MLSKRTYIVQSKSWKDILCNRKGTDYSPQIGIPPVFFFLLRNTIGNKNTPIYPTYQLLTFKIEKTIDK